jgi:NADH:ubiquinone oxidoreductase subunit E
MLSDATRATIDHWVAKFPPDKKRSALIQSLLAAQQQNGGWITPELTEAVAAYLELPPLWAHEVVSFYSMFFTRPRPGSASSWAAPLRTAASPWSGRKSAWPVAVARR